MDNKNTHMEYLGDTIKKRRQELGLTQEELAKKVGYSTKDSICRIEKGLINVPANRITAFSKVLGLHPSEFFDINFGESKPNPLFEDYKIILDVLEEASEEEMHQIRLIVETFRKE